VILSAADQKKVATSRDNRLERYQLHGRSDGHVGREVDVDAGIGPDQQQTNANRVIFDDDDDEFDWNAKLDGGTETPNGETKRQRREHWMRTSVNVTTKNETQRNIPELGEHIDSKMNVRCVEGVWILFGMSEGPG
jgi:hypothetical protein